MNTEQILKVLKNERECIKNNHDYCYEDCDESCPYYVSEKDKLEVYDFLINGYELLQNEGAESYSIRFRPQTEEPLTEFDATPLSGDFKTVAHSRVMAEMWKKGDTD